MFCRLVKPKKAYVTGTVETATAKTFLSNPLLQREVLGPYPLIIRCNDVAQMTDAATHLKGQLNRNVMASEREFQRNGEILEAIKNRC